MQTNCQQCEQVFTITSDEQNFLSKLQLNFGENKVLIPLPTNCPDCRQQIRTAHRNEQYMYHRKSDFSNEQLVALYPQEAPNGAPYKVYSKAEWWSDNWDAMSFGQDFDFSRNFFPQWHALHKAVPKINLVTVDNENSPYTTGTGYCKNCYLINSSEYCEDCHYGKLLQGCRDCYDCSYLYDSELCYECFSCYSCYNCQFLFYSSNCRDCYYSENLNNCENCFLCTNLNRRQFCFQNEQLTEAEYNQKIAEYLGSYQAQQNALQTLNQLRKKRIHKYANISNSENCTGDFIKGSQNCLDCYDVNNSQDCRYVNVGVKIKDCYDCSNMYLRPELCYQTMGTIETYNCHFCLYGFHSNNLLYCELMYSCNDCFGCVGLHKKQYCIFNKQYTKEQYETLVPKIITHMHQTSEWGQFFPPEYSPHCYNESLSSEYFPLSKEQVLAKGWHWRDEIEKKSYKGPEIDIPDHINNVNADICNEILICKTTQKPYKIIPQELAYYRKANIPIPHHCPDQRHKNRMQLRNPRQLWDRNCMRCRVPFKTTYSPQQPQTIYCENCYLHSIY